MYFKMEDVYIKANDLICNGEILITLEIDDTVIKNQEFIQDLSPTAVKDQLKVRKSDRNDVSPVVEFETYYCTG